MLTLSLYILLCSFLSLIRRKYSAQPKIIHSYGNDDNDDDDDDSEKIKEAKKKKEKSPKSCEPVVPVSAQESALVRIAGNHKEGGKFCKCGSENQS